MLNRLTPGLRCIALAGVNRRSAFVQRDADDGIDRVSGRPIFLTRADGVTAAERTRLQFAGAETLFDVVP